MVKLTKFILSFSKELLGILFGGVPLGSPNPNPVSDQKMTFFTPVFRPGL